ncbi:M50 family metallopeptidase [bacterium]|nr:M50 family metallopeptidase [bacterium]
MFLLLIFLVALTMALWLHSLSHYIFASKIAKLSCSVQFGLGPKLWGSNDNEGVKFGLVFFLSRFKLNCSESQKNTLKIRYWQGMPFFVGIVSSLIIATVFIFGLYYFVPEQKLLNKELLMHPPAVIGVVNPGSAAAKGGLMSNDKVLQINGKNVNDWQDMIAKINTFQGDLTFLIERHQGKQTLNITPIYNEDLQRKIVGVTLKKPEVGTETVNRTLWQSTTLSCKYISEIFKSFFTEYLTFKWLKPNTGPVQIAKAELEHKSSLWATFIFMISQCSLGLVIWNLLPLPPFDMGNGLCRLLGMGDEKLRKLRLGGITLIVFIILVVIMVDINNIWDFW